MATPYVSESDDSIEDNLSQAFNAANINDTRRRSSTTYEPRQIRNEQSDANEEEAASLEPVEEDVDEPEFNPDNPPANMRPRRRKQQNPLSRLQNLEKLIRKLQMSPGFLIPRAPFGRLVRELIVRYGTPDFRVTLGALEALQTSTEMYVTQRLQDSYLLTLHRGRVTLEVRDLRLMMFICEQFGHL